MTDGARRHFVLGGAVALLGMVLVVLLVRSADKDGGRKGFGLGRAMSGDSSFAISGDATAPITRGSSAAIDLGFANPRRLPLVVSEVRVRVRAVRAPHADAAHACSASDYTVEQVPAGMTITIPARGTRTLSGLGLTRDTWPRVGLVDRPVNQDGCKGASVVLAYSASGSIGW